VEVADVHRRDGPGGDGAEVGGPQALGGDAGEDVGREVDEAVLEAGGPGERAARLLGQAVERRRRVLERLALEQLREEQVALLPEGELVVDVDVAHPRQQPAALELHEGCGDEEELGRHLEVEAAVRRLEQAVGLGEEGVDDRADRHLVEVDLLAHDQVEQQVEGALEHGRAHVVGHRETVTGPASGAGDGRARS
jgi:hypothetical protein